MKRFLFVSLMLVSSLSMANLSTFNGIYVWQGPDNGLGFVTIPDYFRDTGEVGYFNYVRPPRPLYAKIPIGTRFTITSVRGGLLFHHIGLRGTYSPSQLTGPTQTFVSLDPEKRATPHEAIEIGPKHIRIQIRTGNLVAGSSGLLLIQKLDNGDLLLESNTKGWAVHPLFPFASLFPVKEKSRYLIKRIR